jgi:hypothetical protein
MVLFRRITRPAWIERERRRRPVASVGGGLGALILFAVLPDCLHVAEQAGVQELVSIPLQ